MGWEDVIVQLPLRDEEIVAGLAGASGLPPGRVSIWARE